jgi:hypothetical protein
MAEQYDGKGKYLPEWVRNYALEEEKKSMKSKKFQPCSRCPNPASCAAAGKCLAKSF